MMFPFMMPSRNLLYFDSCILTCDLKVFNRMVFFYFPGAVIHSMKKHSEPAEEPRSSSLLFLVLGIILNLSKVNSR